MKLIVLGCGTSSGVPRIGGDWGACDPANPRNRRTRASILVRNATTTILVDTGPDMREFFVQPWVMVASDGGIGMRHPRATGTFPRVLGRYVREQKWVTLPEAVRKMTSLPAARLGLKDRGVIREGFKADLVLFDPAVVMDQSTFPEPGKLSVGIAKVMVNGQVVWDGSKPTAARPGVVIARPLKAP